VPLELFQRRGIYYIRGTVRRISVYESTRTRDPEIAEAVRVAREAEVSQESVFGKKATATFEQAALAYIKRGGSMKYLIEEGKVSKKVTGLVPHFKGRMLHTIKQADLDDAARRLFPNAGPATRNRQCYTPFIAVWNGAVRDGSAESRKWERPKVAKGTAVRPKSDRAGQRPVSYEHAWKFVSAMSPAPAMVMTTLFYTGMRPIELFALEAADVNVAGRWIVVRASKTGPGRGVPMHEVLVPLFTAIAKRGGRAFRTYRNEPYPITDDDTKGQVSSAISGARKRSGIKDISPYTGRHTVSTQLVINGVHEYIKDQILGHSATSMSRLYVQVPQRPLIEAINTLPVIEAWRDAPWMHDPIKWQRRLVRYENNGRSGAKSTKSVQHLPEWSIND
jgi:integrase/recombinase XerD